MTATGVLSATCSLFLRRRASAQGGVRWLTPMAMQTTQGVLARGVAAELRSRHIRLPTVALIEKLCAMALTRTEQLTFRRLT